jgi:hypothetical protein
MLSGANVNQLDQTSTKFKRAASELETARSTINRAVEAAWWAGPGAERFRTEWNGRMAPGLTVSAQSLVDLALQLTAQAGEQRQASEAHRTEATQDRSDIPSYRPQYLRPGKPFETDEDRRLEAEKTTFEKVSAAAASATMLGDVLKDRIKLVREHLRGGKPIQQYYRWKPGETSRLFHFGDSANDAARAADALSRFKPIEKGLLPLEIYLQFLQDQKLQNPADVEAGRLVAATALNWAAGSVSVEVALAAATAFGGPIGFAVGLAAIGGWYLFTNSHYYEDLLHVGGWAGDKIGDGVVAGAHAIANAGRGAAHAAHAAANTVKHAASSAGHGVKHAADSAAHGIGNAIHGTSHAISFWN